MFLLLLGVCVCVSGCECLTLSVPGVAGARAGCPEAPVTCKVAKGEWMTCEQQQQKTKKGCWISTSFAGFPTTRGLGVGSVHLVCLFFLGGGRGFTCCGDATSGRRVPTREQSLEARWPHSHIL